MFTRVFPGFALLLVACTRTDSGDATAAPPLTLVEKLRLDPNVEDFSVVTGLGVGPRGQIAVLQHQDAQVRLYDSAGARIATIGRRGSGPGEFQFPARAGWIADTMYVIDLRLPRTVYVAPDGSVIRTSALPDNVAFGAPLEGDTLDLGFFAPIGLRADGALFGEAFVPGPKGPMETRVFVLAPAGAPGSELARIVATPPTLDDEHLFMRVDQFARLVPFAARPLVQVAPDVSRFAWLITEFSDAMNGTFTLSAFDANGDTILVRSYPFRGIRIPQSVRDSVLDALAAEKARQREGPPDLYDRYQALARERMPAAYPPVIAMQLGLDGTTWLTMRDTADVRRALVLDDRGEPLGTFVLPPRTSVRHGTRTHVWVTQRDEDGLAAVVRYQLVTSR